jgi:ribosomal 30S subunit maturation factor RimM
MDVLELDLGAVDPVFVPCLREFVLAVDVRGQRVDISPEALEVDE